jgi:hypothetical protein
MAQEEQPEELEFECFDPITYHPQSQETQALSQTG